MTHEICPLCNKNNYRLIRNICQSCYNLANYHNNLDGYKTKFSNVNDINLTNIQYEFITGSLLGDGWLSNLKYGRKNSNFGIDRNLNDLEYLRWQFSFVKNLCNRDIIIRERYNKTTKKYYSHCIFETRYLPVLTSIRKLWYPNEKKIIPNNLELSRLIIQIWYCDDGSLEIYDTGKFRIKLATNGFSKDEVIFLADLLKNRYCENFSIHKDGSNFRIVANSNVAPILLNDLNFNKPPIPRKFL